MNKFDKALKILGIEKQNANPSDGDLVKLRAVCARASIDFQNLESENQKLIKENVKMAKRKEKLMCKIKHAKQETEQLRELLFSLTREIQRDTVSKKLLKQISKVLKAKKV